jgi:hypothetical protein
LRAQPKEGLPTPSKVQGNEKFKKGVENAYVSGSEGIVVVGPRVNCLGQTPSTPRTCQTPSLLKTSQTPTTPSAIMAFTVKCHMRLLSDIGAMQHMTVSQQSNKIHIDHSSHSTMHPCRGLHAPMQ